MCQIRDNDTAARGHDLPVDLTDDDVVILIVHDLIPGLKEVIVMLRNTFLMQIKI